MSWDFLPLFAVVGLLAGTGGRLLLARLRRGVRLPAGPCELAGVLLFSLIGARWAAGAVPGWWVPIPLAVTVIGLPLVAVDLVRRRLPDALTLPAYLLVGGALAAASLAVGEPRLLAGAVLGGLVFWLVHLLVHLCAPASLGGGDVKLSGSMGVVLGAVGLPALVVAACLASVLTLLLAGIGRLSRQTPWRCGVPHGPGLVAATWLVAVFPGTGLEVG